MKIVIEGNSHGNEWERGMQLVRREEQQTLHGERQVVGEDVGWQRSAWEACGVPGREEIAGRSKWEEGTQGCFWSVVRERDWNYAGPGGFHAKMKRGHSRWWARKTRLWTQAGAPIWAC